MRKVPFLRVLRINLKTTLRMKDLILTVVTFSLMGLFSVYEVATYPSSCAKNVWDVLFVAFMGPSISNDHLFSFIFWFLPYLMFFTCSEILQRKNYHRGVSLSYLSLAHEGDGGLER